MFFSQWYYKPGPLKVIGQFSPAMKWQIRDTRALLCSNIVIQSSFFISSVLGLNMGLFERFRDVFLRISLLLLLLILQVLLQN